MSNKMKTRARGRLTRVLNNLALGEDLQFYNCNRRVTRALAKKMNLVTLNTIPLKKSGKSMRLKTETTNNNKRKIIEDVDIAEDYDEPQPERVEKKKSLVVLYDKKKKSKLENTMRMDVNHNESIHNHGDGPQSATANTTITDEESKLIQNILDMMEEYGVINEMERPSTLEELRTNLMAGTENIKESIDSLMTLYNKPDDNINDGI